MADVTILQLPTLSPAAITGADVLPIVDVSDLTDPGGTTKQVTVDGLGYYTIPQSGRTTQNLQAYLANGAVNTVLDYNPMPALPINTGVNDATASFVAAFAASVTNGLPVVVPSGTYLISSMLTLPDSVVLLGTRRTSILKGTAALTSNYLLKCGNENLVQGLFLDGSLTTGASGLGVAVGSIVNNNVIVRDLDINSFAGNAATSCAIQYNNGVGCHFENIYCKFNASGVVIAGTVTSAPTDTVFQNVYVYEASAHKGFSISTGTNLYFLNCVAEACWEQGIYITNATTGIQIFGIVFESCYVDSNWFSLNGNASRANQYSIEIIGNLTNNIHINVALKDCSMNETPGTLAPKALHLTDAYNFILDNPTTPNVACMTFDGNTFGNIVNWLDVLGGVLGAKSSLFGNQITNTSAGIVYVDGLVYGTTAPASGTYKRGQIVINSAPAVGTPFLWSCTTAGSPGTWTGLYLPAAVASGGAAPAGGTGATAGAYDTAAHRDALIALVNTMRTALITLGILT